MSPARISLCLFIALSLSTGAAAQVGTTLLVKTDMSCNWKLDGKAQDPLAAGDSAVVLVSPGEHTVEAETTDKVASIRTRVTVQKVEKTVSIQLKDQYAKQSAMQQDDAARIRAGEALTATWTDPATNLMWTRDDNGSNVDWRKATAYCHDLKLGSYRDWRLPTFDELQDIYDKSISSKVKFDNGITYNVHVKGHLKLTGWSWSSTEGDGPGEPWQQAYFLNFGFDPDANEHVEGSGTHVFMTFDYTMRALCVRRAGR